MTRRPWIVYLVLAALAHPILEMLLFGEQALQPAHDNFDNDIPRLFSIAADWRQFGPSLWDPHLTSGNALFAQFAQPPLAPDVLLSFVVPPFVAFFLAAALLAFLGGLSMHLFLRDSLRLPAAACFAGGALAVFASWPYIYGFGAPLLPLAMLWSEQAAAASGRQGRRAIVRLALLAGFLVLSSQIQVTVLAAAVAVIWGLATIPGWRARAAAEAASGAGSSIPGRAAEAAAGAGRLLAARIGRLAAGWAGGLLLGAPVLLTLGLALGDSQRTLWVLEPVAKPLQAWLDQVAAVAFGVPTAKLGGFDQTYGSFYPGVIGLPLLLVSVAIPRPDRRSRAALWLLVGLLLADLIALLVMPLQAGSPLLKSFQLVRVLHLVPVLLVVNIALAVGWLATPGALTRIGAARRAAVVGLALLGAALVAVQLPPVAKQIGAWLAAGAPLSAMAQSTLAWLLAAIACAAGILGAAAAGAFAMARRFRGGDGPSRGRMAGAAVVACLVVGLAVDRAAFTRFGLLSGPNMGTWAAWTEPTAAHEYVATQEGGGRVISVLEHPNRGLTARLDGVDGYETVYPKAYHALFGLLIAPQLEASPGLSEYFGTWGNRAYAFTPAISEPIADLLGVRWMLVADAAVDASLTDRAGEQAPVPSWLHEVTKLDGTTVYENPNAFPRAFVVHGIAVDPDVEAATAALAAASPADLRSTVHVVAADADAAGIVLSSTPETAAGPGSPGSPGNASSPGSPSEAVFTMDTPDRLEIGTSTASEGVLVVADTDARGWVAELDGKPTELFRVDLALRGVKVPAGDHVVTMLYRPIETYAGFAISALTLVAMLVWLVLSAVARRREPQRKATVSEA